MNTILPSQIPEKNAQLYFYNLQWIDLCFRTFIRAVFHGSDMSGALLKGSSLLRCAFTCCNLKGTSFKDADCTGSDFRHSDCRGANFSGTTLTRCKTKGANFEGALYDSKTNFPESFYPLKRGMVRRLS